MNDDQSTTAITANTPKKIYLKDYTPPTFGVQTVDLDIRIFDDETLVETTLVMVREHVGDLVLFGRKLELLTLTIDGKVCADNEYHHGNEALTIKRDTAIGETMVVHTKVRIHPESNTELEGLYLAGGGTDTAMFVTQCEPEGFRKITFYPDRPDVLATFTTRLEAPKSLPTLLANGNLIETGDVGDARHYAIWQDPTKKPSYLFACVAADLAVLVDEFITLDGRKVLLEVYAEPKDIDKCHVAMQALKDAMKWDEDTYGRAYDLDRYMIVATGQFNMGAMENKGLNIFNTSCVLADADSATDVRHFRVKSVIAHEYFHNWTGNRITCRDWFQLCLKEGLTVYRDQCFSADFGSSSVQRIEDVGVLRAAQFPEDASPLAHPVRPDSFVEINNFYTSTVYEKGAEIVRMMANLLGREKYRAGMDEYFRRHDGQAVTIEDFISSLATQDERIYDFLAWYEQPATPILNGSHQVIDGKVVLTLAQSTRQVAGFDEPKVLPIPVAVAVFDGSDGTLLGEEMLLLSTAKASFDLAVELGGATPLVSVLRGFSAPVLLDYQYSDDELAKLVAYETDGFNCWQAIQMLVQRYLFGQLRDDTLLTYALRQAVAKLKDCDPMLAARLFDIPSEKEMAAAVNADYVPSAIKATRDALKDKVATAFADVLVEWYQALPLEDYADTPMAAGKRALRNVLLELMPRAGIETARVAVYQYQNATCMTERLGALSVVVQHDLANGQDDKTSLLQAFYERYADDDLVIDSWFGLQAGVEKAGVAQIAALMARSDFDWRTPNRVRAVLATLAARPVLLWSEEGLTLYLESLVKLDELNPQLAARLLGALSRWHTLAEPAKTYAKTQLETFKTKVKSNNVLEFVHQMLKV
ncbi:MAG: aminopeptidase N [Moraxella sp.]|nr:aminopeptidase N [Moraxella sp.]